MSLHTRARWLTPRRLNSLFWAVGMSGAPLQDLHARGCTQSGATVNSLVLEHMAIASIDRQAGRPLSGEAGERKAFVLDAQQLVVLGQALGVAHRTDLD